MPRARTVLAALLAACLAADAGAAAPHLIRRAQPVLDTVVEILVWEADDERASRAIDAAFKELSRVDALLSARDVNGPLYEINRQAGVAPVRAPPEILHLIETAAQVSRESDGAFDLTAAAFNDLWRFPPPRGFRAPTPEAIRTRLEHVGYEKLKADEEAGTVFLPQKGMRLSFDGVARGHAADAAAAALAEKGMENFLINAGTDLRARGAKGPEPWSAGVPNPRKRGAYLASFPARDSAVAHRGDFLRFFIENGIRYHHAIDPRTGWPVKGLRGVTVVAGDGARAGALAAAVLVLGPRPGLALVERLDGVGAALVGEDGRVSVSAGLRDRVRPGSGQEKDLFR